MSSNRYPPELRERAVRMLLEQRSEYKSEHAAFKSITPRIGCNPDTLRAWVRQHESNFGASASDSNLTSSERQRLNELEREVRELRRSNDILRQVSSYYDRIVDVMEELMKFTLLTRGNSAYLVDRYSERKESAEELSRRVNQNKI